MSEPSVVPNAAEAKALLLAQDPFLLLLHVNDSTDDQVLFQAACRSAKVPFNWHVADSAGKGISYLQALLKQSKSTYVHWPDLVLLDIVMPGADGFEVLKFIRETPELKSLPVIIFSGHASPELRRQAFELGANAFLQKPLEFEEIVALAKDLYKTWCRPQGGLPHP